MFLLYLMFFSKYRDSMRCIVLILCATAQFFENKKASCHCENLLKSITETNHYASKEKNYFLYYFIVLSKKYSPFYCN